MKVYKPQELLDLPINSVPEAIQGTITKLQAKPVEGGSGDKAYKFQNATLEHDGSSIEIVFNNRDTLPSSYNGKEVIIKAKEKNDGSLFGIKRKLGREYKGNKPPQVWVYSGADISVPDSSSNTAETTESEASVESDTDDSFSEVRPHFKRMIKCMGICIDSAYYVSKQQEEKGVELSEEHIRTIASSFFIQADRQGLINKIK